MKTMKGPGIFLAQFVGPDAPFNSLPSIAKWAKDKGFIGVQIPTGEASLFGRGKRHVLRRDEGHARRHGHADH